MTKKLLLMLCMIAYGAAHAQKFELGKVSIAEISEKAHPADTSAAAAYLYKEGKTYFETNSTGFVMVTEIAYRIKIYKKEGYDYATAKLAGYIGGAPVKFYFSDAYTYNLKDGKVEKTKLRSDGEFTEKTSKDVEVKKITLPAIKEGSIIEYKTTVKTPYFTSIKDWYFQYPIPANNVTYEVSLPVYFSYNKFLSGYIKIDQTPLKVRNAVSGENFQEAMMKYTAKNVAALEEEDFVINMDNYTSILRHELASTNFPSIGIENYSTDWNSVAKKIYEDDDFGKELNYTSYFEEDIAQVIKPGMNPEGKMNAVFDYVKNRMNWSSENSYYCENGVKKAYKDKVGNSAEINLMLTAMLRHAGLDANPVLTSTRDNGVAVYPNRTAYNYVIAGVDNGKEIILLDATSKNTLPNILPFRALNWIGRMILKNGKTREIDLAPVKSSRQNVTVNVKMDNKGKVTGQGRIQHFDYYAYRYREKYKGVSQDSYLEGFEKKHNGIEIDTYKVVNDDLSKPVTEDFNFAHNGLADITGDRIYFYPLLYLAETVNPFTQEVRQYPVDFSFPYQDKFMISITIPDGYMVESFPQPLFIAMEQNIGQFKYNIITKNNQVQLVASIDINYANLSQDYYRTLKDFYQKVVDKQSEKIVLKRI